MTDGIIQKVFKKYTTTNPIPFTTDLEKVNEVILKLERELIEEVKKEFKYVTIGKNPMKWLPCNLTLQKLIGDSK